MLFTSFTYVFFFFAFVLPLRWHLPARWVAPFLLVASYAFYLSWGWKYGFLIGGLTLFTYLVAMAMERRPSQKRIVLGVAVSVLLCVLATFKYANFVLGNFPHAPKVDVVLPLGISFYVFEMICYVVDVYRGAPRARDVLTFFLYIAYFPHLVAGPIVRPGELLPQLTRPRRFSSEQAAEGMFIALVGFTKKMVLADNLAIWATTIFADPKGHSVAGVWLGVAAYTGQIYCDFSGYTDIARGSSLMLGYPLPENFDYPYLSASITEFWRRWHMTLSRWLRDYLYISLGGNRHGRLATYRNLFVTMLLGGLWHGARWTFVAWGAYHGLLLALHKLFSEASGNLPLLERARRSWPYRVLSVATTLLVVMVGWVFFRAETFPMAWGVLTRMFTLPRPGALETSPDFVVTQRYLVALLFLHAFGSARVGLRSHRAMPPAARGVLWASLVGLCYLFATHAAEFIYFNF